MRLCGNRIETELPYSEEYSEDLEHPYGDRGGAHPDRKSIYENLVSAIVLSETVGMKYHMKSQDVPSSFECGEATPSTAHTLARISHADTPTDTDMPSNAASSTPTL